LSGGVEVSAETGHLREVRASHLKVGVCGVVVNGSTARVPGRVASDPKEIGYGVEGEAVCQPLRDLMPMGFEQLP
jgi:hypothetical protein